jgi:hypothetical protein
VCDFSKFESHPYMHVYKKRDNFRANFAFLM